MSARTSSGTPDPASSTVITAPPSSWEAITQIGVPSGVCLRGVGDEVLHDALDLGGIHRHHYRMHLNAERRSANQILVGGHPPDELADIHRLELWSHHPPG